MDLINSQLNNSNWYISGHNMTNELDHSITITTIEPIKWNEDGNSDNSNNTSNESINCSNADIFNVTETAPIEYARVMYGVMMPFLVTITLAANLLIVAVLNKRHMKTPTNLVLMWMAVADLLTLVSPFPWYVYMYTLGNHAILLHTPFLCYAYSVMIEHIPMFFHTTSIWLTILLAGQRYIYICHPTIAKTLCTVPKVNRAIITMFVASFSVQISRFFDTQYESVLCRSDSDHLMLPACVQTVSSWVTRPDIYFPLYFGFRILFVNLGPCIALVIMNVLLFCALQRAQATRRKLLNEKNETTRKKRNDLSNSTTYMLIVVVSVFLLVEIPMAIATLVHLLVNMRVIQFEGDSHLPYTQLTVLLCNFFIMLSFPLNFAIYCGMSAQFRNTFKTLLVDTGLFYCSNNDNNSDNNNQQQQMKENQHHHHHQQQQQQRQQGYIGGSQSMVPGDNTVSVAIVADGTSLGPNTICRVSSALSNVNPTSSSKAKEKQNGNVLAY